MNKSIVILLVVLTSFSLMFCQKELSGDSINENNPSGFNATLQGNIIDETGAPASGVVIRVGDKTATTNDKGFFRIKNAILNKNASVVTAEKAGYFKSYRSFNATSGTNYVSIELIRRNLTGTISNAGGSVDIAGGSTVELPANSVTRADGTPYTGSINVYAAYINPTAENINRIVPGSFMADDENGKRVALASYGMLAVELESTAGEKLQIAAGKEAKLTSKIPSTLLGSAPAQIPLWYVDEKTGIWKEEGVASKQGDTYVGTVKHFSFWNYDISIPAVILTVTLKNSDGAPIVYGTIRIKRLNNYGDAYGQTDSSGKVSGLVPANENLRLLILDPCGNPIDSMNIGPLVKNTDIGTLTSTEVTDKQIRFQGKIVDCNGASVSKGYAVIYYNNNQLYAAVNQNGNFSIAVMNCQPLPQSGTYLGVDENGQQQSAAATVAITNPVVNIGTIIACGNSSVQYINYKLDNAANVSLTDSLMSFTRQAFGQYPWSTTFHGYKIGAQGKKISLNFEHNDATGVYPIRWISVEQYNSATFTAPSNVTLTNMPQMPGEFYEGSFTAKFKDSLATGEHNLTGTFRIRK